MKHFNELFHKNIIQKVTIYGSVITLTGTDGTADITINDIPNKVSATFLTDLTTTAHNWVVANIEHYEYHGYSISDSLGVISVTPKSDWDTVNRINATISNLTEDLSGTLTGVFEPDFSKADIWDVTFTMNSTIANPRNPRDGDKMILRLVGTGSYALSWGDAWVSYNSVTIIDINIVTVKVRQVDSLSYATSSFSLSSYWSHQPEVLFFGLYSEISDGKMPNKVDGGATFLTVAGAAGSETYQAPNTAPYQTADTDYIWFKTDVSQRTTTTAELIGYDFTRTIVKYANTAPYAIEAIMILSSDVDTAKMRDDFDLSVWWSNVLSAYGNVKGNRGVGQSVWTAESVGIFDADGNEYTEVVIGSQTWLVENLYTTKYNDASSIPTGLSDANWEAEDGSSGHDGSFKYPDNDVANKSAYGCLYNWYAVNNAKGIAPSGYRVATQADFATLITTLGGVTGMGDKMKEAGTTYWNAVNGGNNSSGFSARGAGQVNPAGGLPSVFKVYMISWLADSFSAANAYRYYLVNNSADCINDDASKNAGCTVRCIKI